MNVTEATVLELEHQLVEGIKTSNVNLLDRLLHDDLLFITPDGQVLKKETDLAAHRAGTMVVYELTPTVERITLFGDTAVVVVVYETKGKMLGEPIEGKFRYLRVWKRVGEGLKVIGGNCTKL
mgnify:CR=1 FL=1